MATIKHKRVTDIPGTPEADHIYYVKKSGASRVVMFESDGSSVVTPIGGRVLFENAGRGYCYTTNQWVTTADDNYGVSQFQWNENSGTATDPLVEWEHQGHIVMPGTFITTIEMTMRADTEVTDLEIYALIKHPDPITGWLTGFDNDSEHTVIDLDRGLWMQDYDVTAPNPQDLTAITMEINDWVDQKSYLCFYVKPVGTLTATRYFKMSYIVNGV